MSTTPDKLGGMIRERREARRWSQAKLAEEAGTTQQTVGRLEKGDVEHSRALPGVLKVLGLSMAGALAGSVEPGDVVPQSLLVGDKGMPLYASTEGGDGAVVINFEPIDYLKWPAPLLHVKEGFGVLVAEESMFPAFEPNDIALVNPRLPPRRGKNCVLLSPDQGPTVRSLIKRFRGQTEGAWRVSQWNPAEDFELSKKDWPRCYSVTGKYDGR